MQTPQLSTWHMLSDVMAACSAGPALPHWAIYIGNPVMPQSASLLTWLLHLVDNNHRLNMVVVLPADSRAPTLNGLFFIFMGRAF